MISNIRLIAAGLEPPKQWLPNLDPGSGIPKAQAMGFLESEVFPFLIKGALFLMFSLSIIFLIVGAIMYITSGGNKEGMAKAKNTITYALIGLSLGVGSAIILSVIAAFLGAEIL